MRKLFTLLLLSISVVGSLVSCCKNETEDNVAITIFGGVRAVVGDVNVAYNIIVSASKPVKKPITIVLSSDAKKEELTFINSILTIEEGATSVSTNVIFLVDKLDYDSYRKISVVASSTVSGVDVKGAITDFFIKRGVENNTIPNFTISVNKMEINTTDEDGIASVMFVLSEPLNKLLEIGWAYDKGLTVEKEGIIPLPEKIIIPTGELSANKIVKVRKGFWGDMPMLFSVNNKSIKIEDSRLVLKFTRDLFPEKPIALCPLISQYSGYAIMKTFTVGDYALMPEHRLDGTYKYDDQTEDISARVVNGSNVSIQLQNAISTKGDPYLLAAWVDWNRNGNLTEDERVLYKSVLAPERGIVAAPYSIGLNIPQYTPYGKYFMRLGVYSDNPAFLGCGVIDNGDIVDITIDYIQQQTIGVSINGGEEEPIFVYDKNITKTFTISIDKIADKPITLNLTVLSTGFDKPSLSISEITIPQGKTSQNETITFVADQLITTQPQSLITVKIVSAIGAEVDEIANAITYKVNYTLREDAKPVKLCDFDVWYSNNIFTESFTIGDYALTPKHNAIDKGYSYADMSGNSDKYPEVTAKIKNGDKISITYGNQDSRSISYISAAWVDWDRDGNVDDSERILYKEWTTPSDRLNQVLGTIEGVFTAPDIVKKGIYIMRIGTSSSNGVSGGCGKVEYADMFDVKIVYL